jgi:hypothetical protein
MSDNQGAYILHIAAIIVQSIKSIITICHLHSNTLLDFRLRSLNNQSSKFTILEMPNLPYPERRIFDADSPVVILSGETPTRIII